jgi:hypothetical protein
MKWSMNMSRGYSRKVFLPLLGLLIGLAGPSGAQQPTGGEPAHDGQLMQMQQGSNVDLQLQRITELLTLTEDQKASMKIVLTEHSQQIEEVFSKYMGDPGLPGQPPSASVRRSMHDAIKAVHVATYAKIDAILNSDQKARLAAWKKKQQSRPLGHKDDMPPPLDDLLGDQKDRGMRGDGPPPM